MIDQKTFARYAADPVAFRADLIVDVDGVARRFGDVQDDWQKADFAALDPALMKCNGRSDAPAKMRAYLERGRGHSKTTDLAVMAVWSMTADRLAEQRRMLPAVAYARLWLNEWSSGGGDALTPTDIDAAFRDDLQPMTGSERDWSFVSAIDLGLTRDCSAVVTLGVGRFGSKVAGKIRLANAKLWRPSLGKKINLLDVERYVLALDDQYNLERVGFDPWQAEHLAQTLEANPRRRSRSQRRHSGSLPWMQEIPPTGANLRDIASLVIESFTDRRLQLYPYEPLRRDLLKLRVEERSYGVRLTSPRDGDGHGDTFSAFSLALFIGHEQAGKKQIVAGPIDDDDDDLTPFQRAIVRHEERAAEYAEENRLLDAASDADDGLNDLRRAMRFSGRL